MSRFEDLLDIADLRHRIEELEIRVDELEKSLKDRDSLVLAADADNYQSA